MSSKFIYFLASAITIIITAIEEFVHVFFEIIDYYSADFTPRKTKAIQWERKYIKMLITLWEQHPMLYDVQHPDYKYSHKRLEAHQKIADHLICYGMEFVTAEDVKKKLMCLRTQHKVEHNLVENSRKYAQNPEEVYVPRWHYYSMMGFLKNYTDTNVINQYIKKVAPHLLNENTNESFESYEADFEKVTVEEDSKEATLQQIYRLQEAMQASKKLKADCTEPSDPLVRPEEQDNNENSYETPSCSTTEVNKLDFDAQKLDQIDQFGALITYEMQSLKSKKVLRQLKMNILKLVYEAQDEDESANDN